MGGIVLTMKNSIRPGIKIIQSEYNHIIWVKLDKTFFGLKDTLYVGVTDPTPRIQLLHF